MIDAASIVEKGKLYIKEEKKMEWERACYSICEKGGLGEVGVEIIKDSIETMRLLEETDMSLENVIKKVAGSWKGTITSLILEILVGKYAKNKRFTEEWSRLKSELKQGIPFDELLVKKFKR